MMEDLESDIAPPILDHRVFRRDDRGAESSRHVVLIEEVPAAVFGPASPQRSRSDRDLVSGRAYDHLDANAILVSHDFVVAPRLGVVG